MWKQLLIFAFVAVTFVASDSSHLKVLRNYKEASKSRIIGGQEVVPHSFPFQAALRINGNAYCGGSLISPNYVITAGHCGVVIRTVDVILGAHNLSNTNEDTQVIIRGSKVIMHEDYNDDTLENDISLIQLSEAAPINDNIKLISLPSAQYIDLTYLDETMTATGWGLYKDVPFPSTRDMSDVLLEVDVPVSNLEDCGEYYIDDDGEYVFDTNICTSGYGNKGTCRGDSGGPLTFEGVLIGLTSFGSDLCEVCSPSVYTRVDHYLDWIAANSDVIL